MQVPSLELSNFCCAQSLDYVAISNSRSLSLYFSGAQDNFEHNDILSTKRIKTSIKSQLSCWEIVAEDCCKGMFRSEGGGFSGSSDDRSRTPVALRLQLGHRRHVGK